MAASDSPISDSDTGDKQQHPETGLPRGIREAIAKVPADNEKTARLAARRFRFNQ